jgi:hypothetical protein
MKSEQLAGQRLTGAVALASFPTVEVSLSSTPAQSPVRWPQLQANRSMFKIFFAVFIFGTVISGCGKASRLGSFQYGGYGDTSYATLFGSVAQILDSGDTSYISGARVQVVENNDTARTSDAGGFVMHFPSGAFNLLVTKKGYQDLMLQNYISEPDQISYTLILLEPGRGKVVADIPERPSLKLLRPTWAVALAWRPIIFGLL